MKKLILPAIVLILSIFLNPFFSDNVYAQEKDPLDCAELRQILGSKECPGWVMTDYSVWCAQTEEELLRYYTDEYGNPGMEHLYKNRAPDYLVDRSITLEELNACGADSTAGQGVNAKENSQNPEQTGQETQPEEQESKQTSNPVQALNDWIKNTFSDLDFEAIEAERLYGRTPQMTEEIIRKAQEEWKALSEESSESPYRLDILNGEIQIKLPGQNEWSDLKQGDRIPPGSTIFTGMDTTTVLSIRDKGVIQILSFTEVTISEEGLADPTKTTTEFDLRAGEVELNLPSGIFTGSLRVTTPTAHNAVRGTHFWVSYDKDKKLSTTGVYEGTVDVKVLGSDKSTLISPNGDKPGVIVVAQKLSVVKLLITGAVAIVVIGGIVFFLKKRGKSRSRGKR